MAGIVSHSTKLAVALAIAASLTGCFDMKQALSVAEDGTATMAIELSVDAAILTMGNQSQPDNFCIEQTTERDGVSYTAVRSMERGDVICNMEMSGALDAIAAMTQSGLVVPGLGEGQAAEAASESTMRLSREGENYRFEVSMPMDLAPKSQDGAAFDATPMLAAMFSGRSLSFTVTAPQIVETSGTISEDGKTATYDYPLALALQEGAEDAEFHAVFSAGRSKFLGIF